MVRISSRYFGVEVNYFKVYTVQLTTKSTTVLTTENNDSITILGVFI